MKVAIVGTRRRDTHEDFLNVLAAFERLRLTWPNAKIHVISGGCPKGGDRFAQEVAKKNGLVLTIFYPDWKRFGKAAGPIRNKLIAAECDIMIACVAEDRTGGTESAIAEAERLGKEVITA